MYRLLYANVAMAPEWLRMMKAFPAECAEAFAKLQNSPTKPTVRAFPQGGQVKFQGKRHNQWAYVLSDTYQLVYLVDESPADGGGPTVWFSKLVRHEFKGIRQ